MAISPGKGVDSGTVCRPSWIVGFGDVTMGVASLNRRLRAVIPLG